MKKIKDAIIGFIIGSLLGLVFIAGIREYDNRPERHTPEELAIQYVMEEYDDVAIAYNVVEYIFTPETIVELEDCEGDENNVYHIYEVTIINNSGDSIVYNVFEALEGGNNLRYFGYKTQDVIDIDVRESE